MLARFGATACDQVVLEKLVGGLLDVANEKMLPEGVNLSMLKPPVEERTR